jgi:hypothetical protein
MNLNKKQEIIGFAVLLFLIAALFPPWVYTFDRNGSHSHSPAGYQFILSAPTPQESGPLYGVEIDLTRLAVEWVSILAASSAVWFCWGTIVFKALKWTGIAVVTALVVYVGILWVRSALKSKEADVAQTFVAQPVDSKIQSTPVLTIDQLRAGAELGQAKYQASLAWRYYLGDGVIKDYVQATGWWRKASDQGYADAQIDLGYCYANGVGLARDPVTAYKWYNVSAAHGITRASSNLASLELTMTPEQVAEGQRLSREFIAFIPDPPIPFTPDPPPGFVSATNAPATKLDLQPLVEPPAAATNAAKAPSATQFLNDAVPSNKAAGHGFDPSLLTPITTNGQK